MRAVLKYIFICLLIPSVIIAGVILFNDKQYAIVSLIVVIMTCVPFILNFEKKENKTRKLVILAVMVALSAAGRFVFAPLPFFKPVTAMVIISALYFGAEFGFLTGSLSAVVSNFYFGQGPWTPFQMFAWGIIGFIAGLLSNPLRRIRILLMIYAAISGAVYSLIMDVWTTLWADGTFNIERFLAAAAASLPILLIYVVSNVIFVLVLNPLFEKKITRLQNKYGI